MRKKKVFIPVIILILLVVVAMSLYKRLDPNYIMRKTAKNIQLDQKVDVSYKNGKRLLVSGSEIPVFKFVPEESAEYTVSLTDISSTEEALLTVDVLDSKMSEYMSTDNEADDDSAQAFTDRIEDSVFLTKGHRYYIVMESVSPTGGEDEYTGSFGLTVSKMAEDIRPPEITAGGTADLKVTGKENSCAVFAPAESGYYLFETDIISENDESGFSSVASVNSSDKTEVALYDGIAYLEAGTEYYVWVSAEDIIGKNAKVRLKCSVVDTVLPDEDGSYELAGPSIIEYVPDRKMNAVIYSQSDGDAQASVYDENGFPLRSDDNSGEKLSTNDKDFAIVFAAVKGKKYYIAVRGDYSKCSVKIGEYIGDGTTLGPDDIAPVSGEENSSQSTAEEEQ